MRNGLKVWALAAAMLVTATVQAGETPVSRGAHTLQTQQQGNGPLADHPGAWLGDMKIREGFSLKIGAELYSRADGSLWASLASPDQGVYDIPAIAVREAGDTIEMELDGLSLKLTWRGGHFDGVFQETGGPALSFPLTRVEAFPKKAAPQTPKAPFPYQDETRAIRSADGVTLGATLSVPEGVARPNAVVLVHGSGPQTRDAGGTFAVLADALARLASRYCDTTSAELLGPPAAMTSTPRTTWRKTCTPRS